MATGYARRRDRRVEAGLDVSAPSPKRRAVREAARREKRAELRAQKRQALHTQRRLAAETVELLRARTVRDQPPLLDQMARVGLNMVDEVAWFGKDLLEWIARQRSPSIGAP